MPSGSRILIVVTSHAEIDAKTRTGLWFEEFSVPFHMFHAQGHSITVASPRGGQAPIDPRSLEDYQETEDNLAARQALDVTEGLDRDFQAADFDVLFFPGGHGTMFDLPDNAEVQRLVRDFFEAGKVVAAVCHGPAALVGAKLSNGSPLVKDRRLTCFTDEEERGVGLDEQMPFLLESRLRELGARFEGADQWKDHVVTDGQLVTGQNPQSSGSTAREVIHLIGRGVPS